MNLGTGLGAIGVCDALKNYLAERFPTFYVYRSYLGSDTADASAASSAGKTAGRIAVVPETFSHEPEARGVLSRQIVVRIVLWKTLAQAATSGETFAPASECDPLVATLEEIALLFTERVVVDESNGTIANLYVPESRLANDAPLYDEEKLTQGVYMGSLRVAVFEKISRS